MEKHRFYCELPGDIWEDGYFMTLVRTSLTSQAIGHPNLLSPAVESSIFVSTA